MPATELPITETTVAESAEHVADILRHANATEAAIYPIGGGTRGNWGLPAVRDGTSLALGRLNTVVDYPARDMTVTVGAGITIDALRGTLAPEGQRLPIDAPHASEATLGGVIACNQSGPMRFGWGTLRDYVIGIRAIDGLGNPFSAGGRVVKNVAGYDFCKLLTGSMGTLGIITEVTLKLRPDPAKKTLLVCAPDDLHHLEELLVALLTSKTTPIAIEYLCGEAFRNADALPPSKTGWLVVGFEGTEAEVDWMAASLIEEWQQLRVTSPQQLTLEESTSLYDRLVNFPADQEAALVLQATGLPSGTSRLVVALQQLDANVSIQAHAGNGVVIAKFTELPPCGFATAVQRVRSVAASLHGYTTVISHPSGDEMTHQCVWGAAEARYDLMTKVKQAFDPHNILNPDRFVYQRS